jgi:hypothetical protein
MVSALQHAMYLMHAGPCMVSSYMGTEGIQLLGFTPGKALRRGYSQSSGPLFLECTISHSGLTYLPHTVSSRLAKILMSSSSSFPCQNVKFPT